MLNAERTVRNYIRIYSYKRAYSPPKVKPLPTEANANQKEEHARLEEALVFYKTRFEDILSNLLMVWEEN